MLIILHFLSFLFFIWGIILWIELQWGNSIHNIIPLLKKKENVHLYPYPWGYDNYTDVYFQFSWEDVVPEVTVSSIKNMDVTCKTQQINWPRNYLVNLAWLVCNMNWSLSGRVSALYSVITGSISSRRYDVIYNWWDQIWSKPLSSVFVCHAQLFTQFSGRGNSIHNVNIYSMFLKDRVLKKYNFTVIRNMYTFGI